jgi:hypothetical protein
MPNDLAQRLERNNAVLWESDGNLWLEIAGGTFCIEKNFSSKGLIFKLQKNGTGNSILMEIAGGGKFFDGKINKHIYEGKLYHTG